jgi:hypothetical protein
VAGPPTASISRPGNNQTYSLGQSVATAFACLDDANGPGIESCTDAGGASSPAGRLDTSKPGTFTYTVTAKSKDGQTATAKITYTVAYGFGGFISPLPKSTLLRSGSTIPVKFVLTDSAGRPIAASTAAALAAAGKVKATLAGPAISPQSAVCAWNPSSLMFQCNIKTPSGLKTGTANAYTITASEDLGSGFITAPAIGQAANPETIYFK